MLTIGSRGSPLALWQANHIQSLLARQAVESSIQVIRTTGDRINNVPIASIGTKSLFTKEIEDALLVGSIDLAVHSLKDLTIDLPAGLCLAATPERGDPHDAVAGGMLTALPEHAVVGTSSLRRSAQLRKIRPDLEIRDIRGNIDTRLRKLDEGHFDAIVLASAGLKRLGLSARISEELEPDIMTPAPGQGALAIETRMEGRGRDAASSINHPETWAAITAERAVLEALGGGCLVPIGAYAQVFRTTLRLRAMMASAGGETVVRESGTGHISEAHAFGWALGERMGRKLSAPTG